MRTVIWQLCKPENCGNIWLNPASILLPWNAISGYSLIYSALPHLKNT